MPRAPCSSTSSPESARRGGIKLNSPIIGGFHVRARKQPALAMNCWHVPLFVRPGPNRQLPHLALLAADSLLQALWFACLACKSHSLYLF